MMSEVKHLAGQIVELAGGLRGAFPYEDCRALLRQVEEEGTGGRKKYRDLIPDLNTYFSMIDSHAGGTEFVLQWDGVRLSQSLGLLKRGFFQSYTKYRALEWRINQVNTPELYRQLAVSDQIRKLLIEMMDRLLESQREKNSARQDQLLLSPA